ncbi:MAG: hypothetical protein V4591_04720 [Bdellovibrionota bacterium]
MSYKPFYDLELFLEACEQGVKAVFVRQKAIETAKSGFGLETQTEILAFLASDGFEYPTFKNSRLLEKGNDADGETYTDAYSFFSGSDYGYLSFYKTRAGKKWIVKSFKINNEVSHLNNPALRDALMKQLVEKKK